MWRRKGYDLQRKRKANHKKKRVRIFKKRKSQEKQSKNLSMET